MTMNAVTFSLPDDVAAKIEEIAAIRGVSIETLLSEMTTKMVDQFEAYKRFEEMAARGKGEVEKALELLRR